jgi:hypothetical protein
MFAQKFVRSSLAFALALTATTSALAHQPARGGYRDSTAIGAAAPEGAPGATYRDRAAHSSASAGVTRIGETSGYRDAFARGPSQGSVRQVALAGR